MPFQSSIQTTDRGPIQLVVNPDTGARASVFNRSFPANTDLAKKSAVLYVASGDYGMTLNTGASTLLPNVIATHARVAAQNIVRAPFVAFMGAGQAAGQTVAKAMIEALSVTTATLATRPVRDRALGMWDAMDIAGKAKAITEWDLERLSGLQEVSAFDQLPPDLATIAKDRFMMLRHIARTGLSASFPKTPSAGDPLCFGIDDAKVMEAAEISLNRLKSDIADIEKATAVLRDVTAMVALSCEINIDSAFALLTGK